MGRILIATAAALVLAACSKPAEAPASRATATPEPPPPAATAPAAPDAAAPAGATAALDGPADGKWKITTTMSAVGAAIPPTEACYKKTSFDDLQKARQGAGVECTDRSFKRDGAAVTGHTACTVGGMKMITDMRITGDMKTAYTMDMTITMDPAPTPALAIQKITVHAERLGDC